ncbi:MAG: flagellar assembly protein FliW [Fimbriimonadaceae bacterium]|nr:flagellar assembly protein FliW [Fimbriimonadaceae bacterium]
MTISSAVQTTRFGLVPYAAADVVTFTHGLLGFPGLRDFVLVNHKDDSPFRWLQSVEDGDTAFLVVDPANYVADYAPEMPPHDAEAVGADAETPVLVYTIVTIPRGRPTDMTINLAGPIVINAATGKAVQVVVEGDAYPIRHRVFPESASEAA